MRRRNPTAWHGLAGEPLSLTPHLCSEGEWKQLAGFVSAREAATWGEGQGSIWEQAGPRASAAAEDSGRGSGSLCSHVLPQGTAASTKNKLPGLITSMETVGAKALEDFADNIKVSLLLPLPRPARGAVSRATRDLAQGPLPRAAPKRAGLP